MKHTLHLKSTSDETRVSIIEFRRLENHVAALLLGLWDTISLHCNKLVAIQIHARNSKRSITGELMTSRILIQDLAESEKQSKKFLRFICLLRLLYQQLQNTAHTTVRDIFYRTVPLYARQKCLNQALEVLSLSLDLLLHFNFNIMASAKGLVWGGPNLTIQLEQENLHLVSCKGPQLIPKFSVSDELLLNPKPDVIVIFEKDAVFKQFCSYQKVSQYNVVAVTGKGFPDRNSQSFLSALWRAHGEIPTLMFVDSDVYGLEIYWQFAKLIPERNKLNLAGPFLLDYSCGWLPLRDREWRRMTSLLKRTAKKFKATDRDQNCVITHRELTRGLMLFKKAEMNVMKTGPDQCLNYYLWRKVLGLLGTGD